MKTLKRILAIIILSNILPLLLGIGNMYDATFNLGFNNPFLDGYVSGFIITILGIIVLITIFRSVEQFKD